VTRHGVAILAGVNDPTLERTIPPLDAWAAKSRMPEVFPVWVGYRNNEWPLDTRLLAALRQRGVEPVIFLESTGVRYDAILAGTYDQSLTALAHKADGLVVRWDQEPNGTGAGFEWQREPKRSLYVKTFQYVSALLRGVANIRMFYCPVGRGARDNDMPDYYPGGQATQVVGFDRYSSAAYGKFPFQQWDYALDYWQTRTPKKPIWVGECGRTYGLPRSARWLKETEQRRVDTCIVFDMLLPQFDDDWRWTPTMYRAFKDM